MNFDRTFPHPQPARNNLVRVASAQEFEEALEELLNRLALLQSET